MVSKVNGIVIKEADAGESGKRITVITKERGKMLLSARGSKNIKSGIMAAAQLFSFCEFTLYEGRGFYSITQADVSESFYNIRNDIKRLAYGAYILELTDRCTFEEMENNEAFELLLRTLSALSGQRHEPRLVTAVYIIRLLYECGFMDVKCCAGCGGELTDSALYGGMSEGLYCPGCAEGMPFSIRGGALRAVKYITESPLARIFAFRASEEVLDEMWRFADVNRKIYFGETYKTLDYINNMNFDIDK